MTQNYIEYMEFIYYLKLIFNKLQTANHNVRTDSKQGVPGERLETPRLVFHQMVLITIIGTLNTDQQIAMIMVLVGMHGSSGLWSSASGGITRKACMHVCVSCFPSRVIQGVDKVRKNT